MALAIMYSESCPSASICPLLSLIEIITNHSPSTQTKSNQILIFGDRGKPHYPVEDKRETSKSIELYCCCRGKLYPLTIIAKAYRPKHKWLPKKYSFVFVLINLTSLVSTDQVQKKSSFRTELVGLISTKTKEYSFGHHFCIRSVNHQNKINTPLEATADHVTTQITFIRKLKLILD